jgi:serine/threonine-protein kinase
VAGEVARAKTTVGPDAHPPKREESDGFVGGWGMPIVRVPEAARRTLLPLAAVLLVGVLGTLGVLFLKSGGMGGPTDWAGAATRAAASLVAKIQAPDPAQPSETITPAPAPVPASRTPTRRAAAPKPQEPAALTVGFLTIYSRIPLEISSGDRRIGTSDDGQMVLTAGSHDLALVNERFGFRSVVRIGVQPGENTAYTVPLPSGSLRVDTTAGAEVWVEGQHVGVAPIPEVPVQIGTREVVVKHPDLGERTESVEVTTGRTSSVTVVLPGRDGEPIPATVPRLAPLSMAPAPRTP